MDLTLTITENNVIYLNGSDEDGDLILVQRIEPLVLRVEDYRKVKPKRWWNL